MTFFKKFIYRAIPVLSAACIICTATLSVNAAADYQFIGMDECSTNELKIWNTVTGAYYTKIHLGSTGNAGYGANRLINIVEADLSNTNLTLDVISNHSTQSTGELTNYLKNASPVKTEIEKYYQNGDSTVIAAVNGDWMHWAHSSDINIKGMTANYRVASGVTILDSEIWCSQITDQEVVYDGPYSFGITSSNQPLIGQVEVVTSININGTKINADGINRAPANNALYVYNNRLNNTNGVPSDAYELVVTVDGSNKFTHNGTVTGTITAIYTSGTTNRPAGLTDNNIIITARGSKTKHISSYRLGDTVTVKTSLRDLWGNTDLWAQCTEAIGGHIMILKDGLAFDSSLKMNTSEYPSNIIGFKDDGSVMMTMVTADTHGKYLGLQFSEMVSFCKEIGYNTCFLLDGGGSTTMVTIDAGEYVERTCYSDGSVRSVWNTLALLYDPTPLCTKQGALDYIKEPASFNPFNIKFKKDLSYAFTGLNGAEISFTDDDTLMLTSIGTNDAYVSFDFTAADEKVDANEYKYLALRYKTQKADATPEFGLFLCPGSITAATPNCYTKFTMDADGEWHTKIIDLSSVSAWKGTLNNIRLDFFEGNSEKGESVEISNFGFAKSAAEASELIKNFESASEATAEPTNSPSASTSDPQATALPQTNGNTPLPDDKDSDSGCGSIIGTEICILLVPCILFVRKKKND